MPATSEVYDCTAHERGVFGKMNVARLVTSSCCGPKTAEKRGIADEVYEFKTTRPKLSHVLTRDEDLSPYIPIIKS
jgi:hypothetical protein